jgi:ubiquinone/menaquinone biosynthesis C-methylase UbiE
MFNALARDASIRNLRGLDVVWNKKLIRPDRGELEIMNILDLQIEDASFDTVLCMEVLQHLEPIDFPKAVHELRRVSRSRLIMTVPYAEPEPVWHNDKRGGHRQSFPEEKIERFFPRAERWMIPRGRNKWSWIMLVEQPDMR